MLTDYERGKRAGLRAAARICDETAATLDEAALQSESDGDRPLSDLTGVGAVYVRHTAARIRAVAPKR